MHQTVAIFYNQPLPSHYDEKGESAAVHDVLNTVNAVKQALDELNFNVELVPLMPPLTTVATILMNLKAAFVFNLFEGFAGEPETEAFVPEACVLNNQPFTGCPADALRLALNKVNAKKRFREKGIPTPDYQELNLDTLYRFKLKFPCIVKPKSEDASHGITSESVVLNPNDLVKQVKRVSAGYGGTVLVEEYISGREFNATVLNGKVLPESEIVYELPPYLPHILTYEAKWQPQSIYYKGSHVICPANTTPAEHAEIVRLALETFKSFGCRGYARVDMRQDSKGELRVIEVNPNPDISPDAGCARQAIAAGMSYTELIKEIVSAAGIGGDNEHKYQTHATGR